MRKLIGAAALLVLACCATPPAAPAIAQCRDAAAAEAQFRQSAQAMIAAHDYPGISYALVRAEGPVFAGGVGVANRASNRPADAETVYQIASVSKMLTGLAVARLAAEGRLDLDAPLARYWAEPARVPKGPGGEEISVRMVAADTAGMPRYPANLVRGDDGAIRSYSVRQMRDALAALRLTAPPGSAFVYTNFGYGVLAEAGAQATHQPSAVEMLRAELFAPLGMNHTGARLTPDMRAHLATPYHEAHPQIAAPLGDTGAMAPAASLFTTVTDFGRYESWELGHDDGALGPHGREARALARTSLDSDTNTEAAHWSFGRYLVHNFVGEHDAILIGGHIDGFGAMAALLPNDNLGVVFMTNTGNAAPFEDFTKQLLNAALEGCSHD